MLDERKTAILKAVVEEYVSTAQPVGSQHVARASGLPVSPATIRNEMAILEQEGYLTQPHTSAGRIPTDKGYRFFVDHLSSPSRLDEARVHEVRQFFDTAHGALEQMLQDTSRLLSRLTNYAAVVVGPGHEDATVRSIQVVALTGRSSLLVAVLSNGTVESQPLDAPDLSEARAAAATAHLSRHLAGKVLQPSLSVPPSGDPELDAFCDTACRALSSALTRPDDQLFVGGASNVAAAFEAVEVVRNVLTALEQQYVVVSLLRDVLDRGLSVAIGAEHGVQPLAACSVVVAPYLVEGEVVGTVGLLGPTRMHYPEALAAVEVVSERLGRRLTEGS
jgi:heat-inducible transcriptional repressor